jgi:hypothetical protein
MQVAGGFFSFSLWQSVKAGEYANPSPSSYSAPSSYGAPPPSVPIPGTSAYQRVQDPFSGGPGYSPPASHMAPAMGVPQVQHTQQPVQQPAAVVASPPPPPAPVAPHHDLV